MAGNSFGDLFHITSFGESHGPGLGVVIDGMPPRVKFDQKELQSWLERRRPGRLEVSTSRNEADKIEVLSGIFEDMTLGTPICVITRNLDQRSSDYSAQMKRVGHADETTELKYGIRDWRGGGRSSGRETLSRVIAGYFASLILKKVKVCALITEVGHIHTQGNNETTKIPQGEKNLLGLHDPLKEKIVKETLINAKKEGESLGGKVQVVIENTPGGLGSPVFDKLKAKLSHALMSIGTITSISFMPEHIRSLEGSKLVMDSKHFSGIEGGITTGGQIDIELGFRAPSTVRANALKGRHDPFILPRALVVIESMIYICLADEYLKQKSMSYTYKMS